MEYREEVSKSFPYKNDYLAGIKSVIEKRKKEADRVRAEHCKNILDDPEPYREELIQMLGWPLTELDHSVMPHVEAEKLYEAESYSIYRMQFEILDGLRLTGLLFRQNKEKCPLVIVQHGGDGSPELISGLYGDTLNYNNMFDCVFQHHVHVFAPQLLLWNAKVCGAEFSRTELDAQLERLGGSITALELYGMIKAMDYFERESYVSGFGMVGLSYGGFYTLFLAAVEKRIRAAVSSCFFSDRDHHAWCDWAWFGASQKLSDGEIACLVYPRKLFITCGSKDPLFKVEEAESEWARMQKLYLKPGQDWVRLAVFEGEHEFYCDEKWVEQFIEALGQ